jgi:aminobenzoyl-glutamate utilization protein B
VTWGQPNGTGMVSVEYTFKGETAHSAGAPWRGRSALDGVELMNVGWNMRREHLRPEQRSHYVITEGGDQPNVVPQEATVWYFIREQDFANISKNFEIANVISDAAAKMSDTSVSRKIVGTAAPRHFNKPMAEAAYSNIEKVGLPVWTEDDQKFAKAVQKVAKGKEEGLATKLKPLGKPLKSRRVAAPTTSVTSLGSCRRLRCAIRRTSPTCQGTLGQRHGDGYADCAQGRRSRLESHRHDDP